MDGIPSEQQGVLPPEAAKAENRLKGHLGHLTKKEEAALQEFKELCTKQGFYQPATASGKASHDEATLIRYLRARKFVPQDAFGQFRDTEVWRKEHDLDALYEQIDIKDYWQSRSVYPQWTGRRDKRGVPLYLYEVGKLNSKKMLEYSSSTTKSGNRGGSDARMLRLFALYENLTRFVMPLCTAAPGRPNPESPVDQSNNIVDISKVGLKQFWNLKSHMQDASQLATAHYPETLDRIFILGAPSFFPTIWGWIKRWFDPITTSKIFVLSQSQVLPTLTQFVDIENIPEKYGGQLKFECGDIPNLEPDLREYLTLEPGPDTERYFLTAPVRWLDAGDDGELEAVGVGTINGKQRQEHLATLHGEAKRVATHRIQLSRATTRQSLASSVAASRVPSTAGRPVSQHQMPYTNNATSPLAHSQKSTAPEQPPISSEQRRSMHVQKPVAPQQMPTNSGGLVEVHGVSPDERVDEAAASVMSSSSMNGTAQNGAPPDKISMPPPPVGLGRQKTEYMTPASDPSELRQLA